MKNNNSEQKDFEKRLRRYMSIERLMMMRNFGYGSAAACLVILLGLIQVQSTDRNNPSFLISAISASVSLPAWLLIGVIYEYYIFLGKESYEHLREESMYNLRGSILCIGGLTILISVYNLISLLSPVASKIFGLSSAVALFTGIYFHAYLSKWFSLKKTRLETNQDTEEN